MKLNFKGHLLYYFLFFFSFLTIFSSGVIDSIDGFQYLAVARSIYYKGKPTTPVYEYDTRKNIHMSVVVGKDGNTYSLTGLGYSLAYLPAVAITDVVYKLYNVSPPIQFPLENDWLIFLTASFTNAIFGAMLGVILFVYFVVLSLTKKQALFLSIISLLATNLFVYTKHSMPQMMFTSFMLLSFLLIKLYSLYRRKYLLFLCGVSYGIMAITYNQTFLLAFLPLVFYYFLLIKPKFNISSFKLVAKDALFAIFGFIPFAIVYLWFENLRSVSSMSLVSASFYKEYLARQTAFPISVFIEGLHGQLFSPGRSIFVYSPMLLTIIFFWTKIKKSLYPEMFTFILLSVIYIVFYAMHYTIGGADQGLYGVWHGELSWGPRYLIPLIPMGMLLISNIYKSLSKKLRYLVFYPFIAIGLYIQILGVLMPYQIKLHDLQNKFFLNGTEYTAAVYSNFLPRYMPIFMMSKKLIKLIRNFPKTYDFGPYNVRLYDGIDFPFNVGPERWRVIEDMGYISFDNNKENMVKDLAFGLINHPISESSESAKLQFVLNNKPLLDKPYQLNVTQRELIKISVKETLIKPRDNKLIIEVDYGTPAVAKLGKQILGLQSFDINGERVNLESIYGPYVSSLGPKLMGIKYENWGGINQDPWKTWHIHTQTYERLPDVWWIRNLYYWDVPRSWIVILFIVELLVLITASVKINKLFNK